MPSFAKRLRQSQSDQETAKLKRSPTLRLHLLAPDMERPHELDVLNIDFTILRNTHYRNLIIKVREPRLPAILTLLGHSISGRWTGISANWNGHEWMIHEHSVIGMEPLNWNRALKGE